MLFKFVLHNTFPDIVRKFNTLTLTATCTEILMSSVQQCDLANTVVTS